MFLYISKTYLKHIQERLQTVSNNTIPSHNYARYSDYNAMTDYTFAENEFGVIATSMCSYCPPILSNVEYRVINKIISRSVRFHKDNILLPMRHLTEGVFQGDECIDQPIPSDKKTIQKAIDSLEKKGLIKMVLDKTCYPFINRCVVLVEKIKELFTVPKLKIGKKHKENSGGRNSPRVGVEKYPSNSKNINSENKDQNQKIPSPSDLGSIVTSVIEDAEKIKERSRTKRKKEVSSSLRFTKTNFRKVWESAEADFAQEHNIVATGLTNKMPGMMFQAYKGKTIFTDPKWQEYITDVVRHWNEYRFYLQKFFKHRVPEYPTFTYFHKLHMKFLEVYRTHRVDNVRSITSQDHVVESMEKEIQELKEENENLKLQSTSKPESYMDKILSGNYRPQRQKVKRVHENTIPELDDFKWGDKL